MSAPTPAERAVGVGAAMVEPIGLAELMTMAELQTRVDRKYPAPRRRGERCRATSSREPVLHRRS